MLAAGSPEDRENSRSLESVTDKKTQAGCSSEPCRPGMSLNSRQRLRDVRADQGSLGTCGTSTACDVCGGTSGGSLLGFQPQSSRLWNGGAQPASQVALRLLVDPLPHT